MKSVGEIAGGEMSQENLNLCLFFIGVFVGLIAGFGMGIFYSVTKWRNK